MCMQILNQRNVPKFRLYLCKNTNNHMKIMKLLQKNHQNRKMFGYIHLFVGKKTNIPDIMQLKSDKQQSYQIN